ncbi:MAG: hypothetical protein ICV53_12110 [Flavisolibacter sp.]|nr:hypothetical protein [Flavisolibacter sp.]
MKNRPLLLCTLLLFLISCMKEKSLEGDGNRSPLLIRSVARIGSDSITNNYDYDGKRRLMHYHTISTFQGASDNFEIFFRRNTTGIIQQAVIRSSQFQTVGVDSLAFQMNYDAGKRRYTSRVATFTLFSNIYKDSIAYTYDASGNIIKSEEFIDDAISGGYQEFVKTEYTYGAQNSPVKANSFSFEPTTGKYEAVIETTYEYDSNINPLPLSIEAFVMENPQLISAHNATKISAKDLTNTSATQTTSYQFTYDRDKKPESAILTSSDIQGALTVTYIYR